MNDQPENIKAFPSDRIGHVGMSLRDYFAIHVQLPTGGIQEWQAREIMGLEPLRAGDSNYYPPGWWEQAEARYRYNCADAMLAERVK